MILHSLNVACLGSKEVLFKLQAGLDTSIGLSYASKALDLDKITE
jgi:hypothetical protein